MINSLITLIVYALILGLLYWLADYLLGMFPLPDPLGLIIRAAVIIILVLIVIGVLLGLTGSGYDIGLPRLR